MSSKEQGNNPQRNERGQWLPGVCPNPRGRPKGSRNAATFTMKEALTEAFWQAGGIAWLVRLAHEEPKIFASLLLRLLPPALPESEDQDGRPYYDPDDEETGLQ
ncbi:MAG: hypothetical protein JJ714_07105 [Acidithiobacillus sp.]|nr:hypothetical protein [Acidithiobacillus sp.]